MAGEWMHHIVFLRFIGACTTLISIIAKTFSAMGSSLGGNAHTYFTCIEIRSKFEHQWVGWCRTIGTFDGSFGYVRG